ncbi:hypothetical protein SLA2020_220310 [Shorea laevis]
MTNLEWFTRILLSACLFALLSTAEASQADNLRSLLKSRRSEKRPPPHSRAKIHNTEAYSSVYIGAQHGLMEDNRLGALPGQPNHVNFNHYAGYVTVDPLAGRALFYYFVESPENSSTNPLVLWLNGGPGCSSFGYGAMMELGPFRVMSDGKTLFLNNYSWNKVANVIFLESPAGVGFSYSNISSDYNHTGDAATAFDSYTFLVNWLERFPHYKSRDLYITGESYAGHYVPQLANVILLNNQNKKTVINLRGIAIGNAFIDDKANMLGQFNYYWTHALNSDETYKGIFKNCNFVNWTLSEKCWDFIADSHYEIGNIDDHNIYAPICQNSERNIGTPGSVDNFDPCSESYVASYLNTPEVQTAFHVKPTTWTHCRHFYNWTDSPTTVLPLIKSLMEKGLRVWLYSGDTDANVPVTSSRSLINTLKLPIKTAWHPWYTKNEVGGYVVEYKGLTFATVRGAGHLVPSYKPESALQMISSFLQGRFPPK